MGLTIFPDLVQGTEEWRAARCGIVTASVVGKLLTSTLRVADNLTSRGVALTLAAERITGYVEPTYDGGDLWRGHMDEPLARDAYSVSIAPVVECGLMVRRFEDFDLGYSPDGLVGDDGLIEIKSRIQRLHLKTILEDRTPSEHMAQLQCALLVSGRAWIDFVSYCGGMPLWTKRVTPDPTWHRAILDAVTAHESAVVDVIDRYRVAVAGLPLTERILPLTDEIEV